MKKFSIKTFGCQMNVHDSEKMAGILKASGMAQAEDQSDADIIIFNTCSIRQKAEQKFRSELGRIKSVKKKRPGVKIAVAGCIAQQRGAEIFKRAGHVDYVIGPQNIHLIGDMVKSEGVKKTALEDNPDIAGLELPALRGEKGRAWVSIMYGCNNFCSYCIVPYTRGREKSRASESILREIRGLAKDGFREVTLLGQNVNSFRSDTDFPELLHKINEIEGLKRIRFVTNHPRDLSDRLVEAMERLDKVCEHIHLPLQSGSTRILGLMNRGYAYGDYKEKIDKLRDRMPDISITSDIIAGFPTETDKDHGDTVKALGEIGFDGIFAFKFSPRPGTAASLMEGQLPEDLKAERLHEILRIQDGITLVKNKGLEGSIADVLVEGLSQTDGDRLTGRTRTNKIVNFKKDPGISAGSIIRVRILEAKKHSLKGEVV
ncbi:MAG: tRNA (N6-isopentenyl adenosine(37)-C2)-methylthiotransferase MiaB [Thermodesulfovibrionales bacterium]|nr:tRNA (N6-isopentenyl adenosine(37)-C2)-methylthiotransferase MiaB [Thermodesulfovibrionales bacterium]